MVKRALILTILMIFLITANVFAWETNEQGDYVLSPNEMETLLDKTQQKDMTIHKQEELIKSLEKENDTLKKAVDKLEEDKATLKEELKLKDEALNEADNTIGSLEKEVEILNERVKASDELIKVEQQDNNSIQKSVEMLIFAVALDRILD